MPGRGSRPPRAAPSAATRKGAVRRSRSPDPARPRRSEPAGGGGSALDHPDVAVGDRERDRLAALGDRRLEAAAGLEQPDRQLVEPVADALEHARRAVDLAALVALAPQHGLA